jgi:DNA repair protein RecN (Recombination protein N)
MLAELAIVNFALVDRAEARFEPGLNLLTGETGAGKSILIGALGFLLGGKGDASSIRTGADELSVSGRFEAQRDSGALAAAEAWLAERGLGLEDGSVSIRRSLKANGRGGAWIQGAPVTRAELAEFAGLLADIHGQNEQQSLLSPERYLRILDGAAGLLSEVDAFAARFAQVSAKRKELEAMRQGELERAREADMLGFALKEISEARIAKGEDEALEAEAAKLSHHEKLFSSAEAARALLSGEGDEGGAALSLVRKSRAQLSQAASIDPGLGALEKRLDEAYYELEDISRSLGDALGAMRYDPERLEKIEERLKDLHKLKRKYGGDIESVLSYAEEAAARLERLSRWDEDRGSLEAEVAAGEREIHKAALAISAKRKEAAAALQSKVEAVARSLGMPRCRFEIRVTPKTGEGGKPLCGQRGLDEADFLVSANEGEPLKPVSRVASGGELSRLMLAIKTVLALGEPADCLVFDEVDAGIGGEVALAVGEHLKGLSARKQVLCVTHLASIAARADNHVRVEKLVEGGRTATRLTRIEGQERVREIARMLAGDSSGEASLKHAEDLVARHSGRG